MRLVAIIVAIAASSAAQAEEGSWPAAMSDGHLTSALAGASKAQPACMAELRRGPEGEACSFYRLTTLKAVSVVDLRNRWCIDKLSDKSRAVPKVCRGKVDGADETLARAGWPEVEALSRKADPGHWARVDAAQAELRH